MGACMLKEVNT